jgi:hypothetical protein
MGNTIRDGFDRSQRSIFGADFTLMHHFFLEGAEALAAGGVENELLDSVSKVLRLHDQYNFQMIVHEPLKYRTC